MIPSFSLFLFSSPALSEKDVFFFLLISFPLASFFVFFSCYGYGIKKHRGFCPGYACCALCVVLSLNRVGKQRSGVVEIIFFMSVLSFFKLTEMQVCVAVDSMNIRLLLHTATNMSLMRKKGKSLTVVFV